MRYNVPPLQLTETSVADRLRTISLEDLPDPQPGHPARLAGASPLMERLWRIALSDVESNVVEAGGSSYFGAGAKFGVKIYTRDIAFSGMLGLNRLYPDRMMASLRFTREVRLRLGFRVSSGYSVPAIGAPWEEEPFDEKAFLAKYHTNSYTRRTDDVIWLWCAEDLVRQRGGRREEWQWLYETGCTCFEFLYRPFYDPDDGLYRGQSCFVDIHHPTSKASGYPKEWTLQDCVLAKALSTNALYVLGMEAMAAAARELGLTADAENWSGRATVLRGAIVRELGRGDGTLAYLKEPGGSLQPRRDALGGALAVLAGIVEGDEAKVLLRGYPVTDAGVPLFDPFFNEDNFYHNNTSWPFVDTFFLRALEQVDGEDRTALNAALLARTCIEDGTFHEVVDLRTGEPLKGSGSQLWSAASFLNVCLRAGYTIRS